MPVCGAFPVAASRTGFSPRSLAQWFYARGGRMKAEDLAKEAADAYSATGLGMSG